MQGFSSLANNRVRTALALTDGLEASNVRRLYGQHVALLRLVTPNFQGAHTRLIAGNTSQIDPATPTPILHQLRQGITEPASSNIVNKGNRTILTQRPAAINDLLTTPLHLWVVALYRGKIESLIAITARH